MYGLKRFEAIRKIAVVSMSTLIVCGSFVMLAPNKKVSAADKKIEEIFEDEKLQDWVRSEVDKDKNGYLSQTEISAVTEVDISKREIESISGMEIFTNMTTFKCFDNKIKEIDTTLFPKLEVLNCKKNQLKTLSVIKLTELKALDCEKNEIEVLNLSQNKKLESVFCDENKIEFLNVGKSPSLRFISADNNKIAEIDVSKLTNLHTLYIADNQLLYIEVNNNADLGTLDVRRNKLTEINISANPTLEYLYVGGNNIGKLDLSSNSKLRQIECDNCGLTKLDLSNKPDMRYVTCSNNRISELDMSGFRYLESFNCSYTDIATIKIPKHLTSLTCEGCLKLTSLDVSNTSLIEIFCGKNPNLKKLDVSNDTILFQLNCYDCALTEINLHGCTRLDHLDCRNNKLTELDISENTALKALDCTKNQLKKINIVGLTTLIEAMERDTEITDEYQWRSYGSGYLRYGIKCDLGVVIDTGEKTYTADPVKPSNPTNPTNPSNPSGSSSSSNPSGSSEPSGTTSVPSSGTFEDFVERLYVVALGRASEEEGKAHWCKVVGNGSYSGADCARFFLTSPEFNERNLNNEEYLKVLYKTFFDRDAAGDPDGFNFWLSKIDEWGRGRVLEGFIDSTEWCNICASYGVKSGAMTAKATKASANATAFATRLYTECLGREPEEGGLNFWSLSLTNQERTGTQAAKEFFYSEEFISKGLSDEDYVTRLYKTFMGREPEADGKAHWLNQLNSGAMNRDQVFDFFSTCEEFTGICNQYAISR